MNRPDDLKFRVVQVLAEEVAPPFLKMDGSQVELLDIQDGTARIRLHGSGDSCPTTIVAVIMGIEEELRRRIPEIEYLEVVS